MNQRFDHAIDLAAFAAQFLGPVAERDIPIRAMMLLQEAQVPSTDFAIHDSRVYLTAKGLTYLNLAAPKAPLPQPHPQLMVNTGGGGGGSLSRGGSPLPSPNGTGSGYLSSDDAQRSLQRKRSISTLRKATLERQKQTTLDRSPTSGLSPTTPTQQSSGSGNEPPKFGGLPPGMLGPPPSAQEQQQQQYALNSEPFPGTAGAGFTTAPTDVVQYMDTLTRTYRQSKDPQVLNAMLQSPEATRVADFLVTSRTGTLTRNQPATSIATAPPPTLVMDPYCQSVYQWLCQLTSTPPTLTRRLPRPYALATSSSTLRNTTCRNPHRPTSSRTTQPTRSTKLSTFSTAADSSACPTRPRSR
ncbi:hypothetical protein BCR44DRAFT_1482794 [Catenaria anguillulae PL171]|uniref:Uncharacterized protein n=1 Tax=Catenaria anguillulae PL171 TaxID=765915 RepID=A0A1Y2HY92_9FUNG|nr:hypothetical protein BCR44DRAFT_1482794 [Catenaria anguillulae PL171]